MKLRKYLKDFLAVDNRLTWTLSKLIIMLHLKLDFITVPVLDDIRVHLHRSKWPVLLLDKKFKAGEKRFYQTFFKDGDTFVDVGANIGAFTLLAASALRKSGHVFAIEPNPKVYRYLSENVALNGLEDVVTLYNVALSDENGKSLFFLRKYGDDLGSLSKQAHDGQAQIEIRTVRGDSLFAEQKDITLLKIDVEGAEFKVLLGFGTLLNRVRFLIFENNPDLFEPFEVTFTTIYDQLAQFGFGIYGFEDTKLSPVNRNYDTREHRDLLAVRKADIVDFETRAALGA